MGAIITIVQNNPLSARVDLRDVDDLSHARRLLLQAILPFVDKDKGSAPSQPAPAAIHLLRGYLVSSGCKDKAAIRRLLLLTLLHMEDEGEAQRLLAAQPILPAASACF